jgi:hypothetical protein
MELGIVRAHDCALVTYELFARVTEVAKRLLVQQTILFAVLGAVTTS